MPCRSAFASRKILSPRIRRINFCEASFQMTNRKIKTHFIASLLLLSIFILFQMSARAGEPIIWETGSRAEILKGDARGISVTDTGAFMLAPRFTQAFDTQQSFVWSS